MPTPTSEDCCVRGAQVVAWSGGGIRNATLFLVALGCWTSGGNVFLFCAAALPMVFVYFSVSYVARGTLCPVEGGSDDAQGMM